MSRGQAVDKLGMSRLGCGGQGRAGEPYFVPMTFRSILMTTPGATRTGT